MGVREGDTCGMPQPNKNTCFGTFRIQSQNPEKKLPAHCPEPKTVFGEAIVSMVEHKGKLYVATAKEIYRLNENGTLEPVMIQR
jgi:hypothetical protein